MDHLHSEHCGYVDNESEEIKNVITQKKRTYRLEIRKKKLQTEFNKLRKPNPPQEQFSNLASLNTNTNEGTSSIFVSPSVETNALLDNLESDITINRKYQENQELIQKYQDKANEIRSYEYLASAAEKLNHLLYNLNEENSKDLDVVLDRIFLEFCKEEQSYQISEQQCQLFLHLSFLQIAKNTKTSLQSKNTALWCLINMSCIQVKGFDIISSLVENDIINLLKAFLKDNKYALLYENAMFLAANIAIDKNTYKQQFLDEGILLVIQNFLFTIIENIKKYQEEISLQLMKSILSFCTSLLVIHQKIDNQQFMIIFRIMELCLKQNLPESFVACLNGVYQLFQPENPLSEWKFNLLYSSRFFAHFFMMCTQTNDEAVDVSKLYKNISAMENDITKFLMQQELCLPMFLLLDHPLMEVRKNMVFSLSNFFQTGKDFVNIASQMMLDTKMLVILENECLDIQKEAIWAIQSLLLTQSPEQKEEFLGGKDMINILCNFLNAHYQDIDDELTDKLLDCFIQALEFGEMQTAQDDAYECNPFWIAMEQLQSVDVLEKIIEHGSDKTSFKAAAMIEKYSWSKAYLRNEQQYPIKAL